MWIKKMRDRRKAWQQFAVRRSEYMGMPDRSAMRNIERLDIQNRYVMRTTRQG